MSILLTAIALGAMADSVRVDPTVRHQVWEGWGTSLAWWAHIVGRYPEPIRSKIVDQALGDLKLNILRYNIGGGENPELKTMEPRARVPGFLRADGTYDWSADEGQRWVLARGKRLGADLFEAFSNSPPYFMTISGSVTGARGGGNNLKPSEDAAFATYLATVVKQFRDKWGIRFKTLSPMNEPAANWWRYDNRQEGCHISPGKRQSEVVVATAKALRDARLPVYVSASDESYNDWAVSSWNAMYPAAKAEVWQINTHCYGGNSQRKLREIADRDRKRLWMSEYGDGDASGMTLAKQIVRDLREMQPSAWVYWQVVDSGAGWGCLDVDLNANSTAVKVNPKFHVFAQFTKHLRPKSQFIEVGDANTVAALDRGKLVLVTVADQARTLNLDLSAFARVGSKASLVRTSKTESQAVLPQVAVQAKSLMLALPEQSVTTITIGNCRP